MSPRPFGFSDLDASLREGWALAMQTRRASLPYAASLAAVGALLVGGLLLAGFAPFILAAAGAFMLIGPVILAGFFGIARAHEAGAKVGWGATAQGIIAAPAALWVLGLVCAFFAMIFLTDAALLYSYLIGAAPIGLAELFPLAPGVASFLFWGILSGLIIAGLLYCVTAFSAPLLIERRAGLVDAVATSVRAVFGSFAPALAWAALLAVLVIGSILLLPLFVLVLPWLAFASRALYLRVLP